MKKFRKLEFIHFDKGAAKFDITNRKMFTSLEHIS